jgi:NAD(P)-dependent dehydrogenase (short-subunit alcohol dehydrogenase family)
MITGAARRVGAAIARRFAAAGWACVIHHHHSKTEAEALQAEIQAAGGRAHLVQFDLADPAAIARGLDQAFGARPGLSVLINSASTFAFDSPADPSPPIWREAMAVNALAPILLASGFAERLAPDLADACVINLLDQKLRNPNPDYFSYTVSKAALAAASEIMARAYAPRLRVVNVAPGLMLPSADQTQAEFERSSRMNLLGRQTGLEELADGVFFLAGNAAITGQTLYIDSGQSLTPQPRDVMFLVRQPDGDA